MLIILNKEVNKAELVRDRFSVVEYGTPQVQGDLVSLSGSRGVRRIYCGNHMVFCDFSDVGLPKLASLIVLGKASPALRIWCEGELGFEPPILAILTEATNQ